MFDPVLFARGIHGHVGLLAAVACVHPAVTLRGTARLRRGTRWAAALATALVTITVVGGWLLYPGYRTGHKRELLHGAMWLARLFETKEHLGFYALVLALAGGVLATVPEGRPSARVCYGAAGALAVVTGVLGSLVAAA